MDRIGRFASPGEGSFAPLEAISSKSSPLEGAFSFFSAVGQEMTECEYVLQTGNIQRLDVEDVWPFLEDVLLQRSGLADLEEESAFFSQYFEIDEEFILEELAEEEVEIFCEDNTSEVDPFSIETLAQEDGNQRERQPPEEEIDPV